MLGTETTKRNKPAIGDKMPDGTVFAGIPPDTGKGMYVTPSDVSLSMKWQKAMDYASTLEAHGHKDWSLPTACELNELYNNRAAIGGFTNGWYWSSTEHNDSDARVQRFNSTPEGVDDGTLHHLLKGFTTLVRCIRR